MSNNTRLFTELQDLKRIQPAHYSHSIASELFMDAWRQIISGRVVSSVAIRTTLRALTAVLFPGVDGSFFAAARLDRPAAHQVLKTALQRVIGQSDQPALYDLLLADLPILIEEYFGNETSKKSAPDLPEALHALCRQPRAGATHPAHPRLILVPPEMHSDHCLLTAVYAVLTADHYGADYGTVFLAGLAHHLHNAYLPDCGYAGEICLGEHLQSVIHNCREQAIAQFSPPLRPRLKEALRHHESIASAEGRAVSAGDVLDRVLDVKWRTRAAAVTDTDILEDLDLVHPGPLKDFQTDLLNEYQLWSIQPA